MDAAAIVRQARTSQQLTLRELARRAETSHATLAAYESARTRPTTQTFARIIDAAGFAIDVHLAPRHRGTTGLPRGEELRQVLELAEQFPARHAPEIEYPPFHAAKAH